MTKKVPQSGTPKSRFPILGTVAGVLAAGAIAWVIVDRFDTPSIQPAVSGATAGKETPRTFDKPLWDDLSSAQRVALAPLEPEWNGMDGLRKRKWIQMSSRFASLPANEQQRVHDRMRQWMKLTPEQRELARENFSRANRVAQGDKAANWENYKQLSDDQKRRLARSKPPAAHKSVPVALPESPMLVVPTPCPPGTTRRGAECIAIDAPAEPAAIAPAASNIAVTPLPATNSTNGTVAVPPAAAPGATAQGSSSPSNQASNAGN